MDTEENCIIAVQEAVSYKKKNPALDIDSLDLPNKLGLKVWGSTKGEPPSQPKNKPPLPDSVITDPTDEKKTRGNMPSDSTISLQPRWDQKPTTKPDTEPMKSGGDITWRPPLATGMENNTIGISKKLPPGQGRERGMET